MGVGDILMGIPTSVALLFSVELKMARSVLEVVFFFGQETVEVSE